MIAQNKKVRKSSHLKSRRMTKIGGRKHVGGISRYPALVEFNKVHVVEKSELLRLKDLEQ